MMRMWLYPLALSLLQLETMYIDCYIPYSYAPTGYEGHSLPFRLHTTTKLEVVRLHGNHIINNRGVTVNGTIHISSSITAMHAQPRGTPPKPQVKSILSLYSSGLRYDISITRLDAVGGPCSVRNHIHTAIATISARVRDG